jgi:tetratricopeptide (TPR) repeat protein
MSGLRTRIVLVSAAAMCGACREEPPAFPIEWLGRFYQAGAQWEMDQHADAAKRYLAMLEPTHRDPAVLANLASSLLGGQQAAQQFEDAERCAREAAAEAPHSAEIQLILAGTLAARQKRDEALALLRATASRHPGHVGAQQALISALHDDGTEQHLDEIARHYELLLGSVPQNLAALLDAARVQALRRDLPAAAALFNRAMAAAPDPPAPLQPYLEQIEPAVAAGDAEALQRVINIGRNLLRGTDRFRTDILALGPVGDKLPRLVPHPLRPLSGPSPRAIEAKVAFEDATQALGLADLANLGAAAIGQIRTGAVLDDRSPALLAGGPAGLFLRREGRFVDAALEADPAGPGPRRDGCFVDLNNDKQMDLVLSGGAADRLFLNRGEGRLADATADSGLASFGPSMGAVPFDFDHDGDLDLLRWNGARLVLQANDGEGRLGEPLARPGLPQGIAGIRDVTVRDFDDDGDADVGVLTGSGPFQLRMFSNERLASFREVTGDLGPLAGPFKVPPIVEDFDRDGLLEIVDAGRRQAWELGPGFKVEAAAFPAAGRAAASPPPGGKSACTAAAGDFDNDGVLDLLVVYSDGSTNLPGLQLAAGAEALVVDLDGDGRVDVLSGDGRAFRNVTTGAGNWLAVSLVGLNTGDSRFNAFGLGSTLEVRAGPHYQKRSVTSPTTHFGLGPFNHADVLRVVWPNGNYQNMEFRASDRLELAANQVVVEEQSLKGSCPYLYAWNGERFEFVTDVLWRSALGMSIMSGVYGHHGTADDYFKITAEQLRLRDGRYTLQFTEELWEVAYFDHCRLLVVDHPADTDFFVDEKCIAPPYPPFEIHPVQTARPVAGATDGQGRDLAPLLARRDGRVIAGFSLTRYQGIVEDHDLILDLGPVAAGQPIKLFLHGWLWPTDASTNVALSQNPLVDVRPPTLAVRGPGAHWQKTDVVVGFPSGKNKTLVLDLTGRLPPGDASVKLSTNFAIFWDHAFVAAGPQDVDLVVTELPVAAADLHERGISRAFARRPHGPTIPEYDLLDPMAQWRDMEGSYTRCGDVTALLAAPDSRYAIVGAGDEVTLTFDAATLAPLRPGWRRDFVLHTDGWLKDGDLNSAGGRTVEPLPFHGMSAYPYPAGEAYPSDPAHAEYLRKYNTRPRDGSRFRDVVRRR